MKLNELIFKDEIIYREDISDTEITNVTTSIKQIDSNTLFVFIKSIKFDINKIINCVLALKPAIILCEEDIKIESDSIPIIRCPNTRRLLSFIFARFYNVNLNSLRFIAITGTNGKTTTATMLHNILTYSGKKSGFIGTGKILINEKQISDFSYSMTTPDPECLYRILKKMQDSGCEYVVMEVSSHALYFEKTAPIEFELSLFTNLSAEHLDFHKTIDEYFKAKMKLFSQTKLGIFNMDDEYSKKAYMLTTCKKSCVGIINNADVMAKDVKLSGLLGSEYIYRECNRLFKIKLHLGGAFNIYNSLMAITAATRLGIKASLIKEALSLLKSIDGRLEILEDEITVIIDYAHTENAFYNILNFLYSAKKPEQKLITLFGCGGERDKLKRPKMARVAEFFSDLVIVTTDNSRQESEIDIIKDILTGFESTQKRKVITSRKAAIEYAILTADKGDTVAIIGKGHERYNYNKSGIHHFDERAIIKEALNKRKDKI